MRALKIAKFKFTLLNTSLCLVFAAPALSIDIPFENQKKGERPPLTNTDAMAMRLLTAIEKDDPKSVQDIFFPEGPFLALKDIPDAKQYYKTLTESFSADIHKQSTGLSVQKTFRFQKFRLGFCKWKDVGTEYNKIPYWSCYRSEIIASQGDKKIVIPVKVIINWGQDWYVTHLGR